MFDLIPADELSAIRTADEARSYIEAAREVATMKFGEVVWDETEGRYRARRLLWVDDASYAEYQSD